MSFTIPAALMSAVASGMEGFCMWLPLLADASATALASDAGITIFCGDDFGAATLFAAFGAGTVLASGSWQRAPGKINQSEHGIALQFWLRFHVSMKGIARLAREMVQTQKMPC